MALYKNQHPPFHWSATHQKEIASKAKPRPLETNYGRNAAKGENIVNVVGAKIQVQSLAWPGVGGVRESNVDA